MGVRGFSARRPLELTMCRFVTSALGVFLKKKNFLKNSFLTHDALQVHLGCTIKNTMK